MATRKGIKSEDRKDVFHRRRNNHEALVNYVKTFDHQREKNNTKSLIYELDTIFFFSLKETIESATVDKRKWQDSIESVVTVPELDSVLTASKKGKLTFYNNQMRPTFCTHILDSYWIIGCVFLQKIKRVAAVADKRIFVWDYNHNIKDYYFIIQPAENYQLCVCSVTSQDQSLNDNVLVGDNAGFVNVYCLDIDKLRLSYSEALSTSSPVVMNVKKFIRFRRKIHNGWVIRVKFIPELNCFGSCSTDDEVQSLVLDSINNLQGNGLLRTFSVSHGIATFEYCIKANLIATAGSDKIIRLWDIKYTKKPLRLLAGHSASVIELAVNEEDQHLISVSRTGEFLVWDLQKFKVLQKFVDKEQGPNKRLNTMIYDNKHLKLMTGSCDLAIWPLTRMIQDTKWVPQTHEKSINVLAYNPVCQQVLSICSESIIKVWEYETGHQIYKRANAHGPSVEVTAAAIDANGSYFATGACDGSLKLWDFESGGELRAIRRIKSYKDKMESFIQLCFLHGMDNKQMIVTLDISGAIKIIQVRKDDNLLLVTVEIITDSDVSLITAKPALNSTENTINLPNTEPLDRLTYSGHQEITYGKPVLCFDTLTIENSVFLATGRVNGTINLYKFDAGAAQHRCCMNDDGQSTVNTILFLYPRKEASVLSSAQSYEHPDQFQEDNTKKMDPEFQRLISDGSSKSGILEHLKSINCSPAADQTYSPLIASGHNDGYLYFWDLTGTMLSKILPVMKHPANPLTALCTNAQSDIVLSGDSKGYIIVWRVSIVQDSENGDIGLEQLIYWRAHLVNVTSLVYEEYKNVVISASDDGSLRLWYVSNGHYIGYFGQPRDFHLSDVRLPCDITEKPVVSRSKSQLDMDQTETESETAMELNIQLPEDLCSDGKLFKSLPTFKVIRSPLKKSIGYDLKYVAVFTNLPIYKLDDLIQVTRSKQEKTLCKASKAHLRKNLKSTINSANMKPRLK